MMLSKRYLYVFALILLYVGNVSCFAAEEIDWRLKEGEAQKTAYYGIVDSVRRTVENDSAFIQLNRAYEIFKKYAVVRKYSFRKGKEYRVPDDDSFGERRWIVKMDDYARQKEVRDSVKSLKLPFFDRIVERSNVVCKNRVLKDKASKEVNDLLLAWYTKNGKYDYFVERVGFRYTTKPCFKIVEPENFLEREKLVDQCKREDFVYVDTMCVNPKGSKRMFLTYDDKVALDLFTGCDRYEGETKAPEDRYNKNGFMPIEPSYNPYDMCFDYGAEYFSSIYIDQKNGVAYFLGNCARYKFIKEDDVWKYYEMIVDCFI